METTTGAPDGRLPSGIWRFGQVALDEALAQLRRDGQPVELDRSSYDVLLALLRHAGEVVTKDELLEAGWPGRVVSENSLAKAISRLRQALGADGEAIRVVHGYGYRLTAAVQLQPAIGPVLAHPEEALRLREGDPVPHRPGWRLQRRLGAGSSGVIFLAVSQDGEAHAFKFADGEAGLHAIKREIALTRYIHAVKADLPRVARVLDWNLRKPPFFIELPYFEDGHLAHWALARGGLAGLELDARLSLCADLCDTVAGLHEIGVIHKDLKPENLYPVVDADGHPRLVLSDLGAGEAALSPRLAELGLTFTLAGGNGARAGSLLYVAPEVIAGDEPTVRSDVFALGVLLYQLVVGNLRRPLAPGWESDVDDPLLREDIALAAASNPERRQVDARTLAHHLRTLDARRAERAQVQEERALAERREQALLRERTRRHLWLTAAVAATLGLVGMAGMYRLAEQARRTAVAEAARADRQTRKAGKLIEFLTDGVLRQADPYVGGHGGDISLRQAIDNAAADVDARFGHDPETAGAIHGSLGAIYGGLNDFEASVAQRRKQLALLRAMRPPDPAEIAAASGQYCMAQVWQGDPALRRRACDRARADYLAAGLVPDFPDAFLAIVDSREGHVARGIARVEPVLRRARASGDEETRNYATWFASILFTQAGRLAAAERAAGERLALISRRPGSSMDLAWALADHGRLLLLTGRQDAGRAELLRAGGMFAAVAGKAHPQGRVPDIFLAESLLARGQWRQARALAEPAYRALFEKTGWEQWTIRAALAAMTAAAESGDAAAARGTMRAFDGLVALGLDQDFPYLREPHWTGYAATHLALGEDARAQPYIERLRRLAAEPDASPLTLATAECLDGRLRLARGDRAAALASARRCRAQLLATVPRSSPLLAVPDRLLAALGRKT